MEITGFPAAVLLLWDYRLAALHTMLLHILLQYLAV